MILCLCEFDTMSQKYHPYGLPEWSGGWSEAGSGSVVGLRLSPSPDSASTPPTSACLFPYAGSQHGPKRREEIRQEDSA